MKATSDSLIWMIMLSATSVYPMQSEKFLTNAKAHTILFSEMEKI